MKAWRWYAISDMRLDDIPYPHPQPGWVTIKTRVVQPSVTEAIRAKGGVTAGVEYIKKKIAEQAPVQLFGHEFCGDVVELGEGVTSLKVGDRVSARARFACHDCVQCKSGNEDRCRKGPILGQQIPGAFCEYLPLPAEVLTVVPAEVGDNEAACLQPFGSCVGEVDDAGIRTGDTVAIIGQGVMGLFILQLVRIGGAGRVIGIDVRDANIRLSKEFGSDDQVDASTVNPVEAVKDLTHGKGADIVFECAGGSPSEGLAGCTTLLQAMELVADAGKVIQTAHIDGPFQFNPALPRHKSVRYLFPMQATARHMEYAARVLANGQINIRRMITHVLDGLEKAPEAFEITANKVKYGAIGPAQVAVSR